jgi:hypothetical protein
MAGFTSRKQALHDKIAGTLVVYKDPNKEPSALLKVVGIILGLIVGVAVLGIISSIVLASLNSARAKNAIPQGSYSNLPNY